MRTLIFILFACLFSTSALSQDGDTIYTHEYLDKSTRFAWTTFGLDAMILSGGTTQYLENGTIMSADFGPSVAPRIQIGGIHFWGHTDFYVSLPINALSIAQKQPGFDRLTYNQGIETGARVYPWKVQTGRLSPFAGISFRSLSFVQNHSANDFTYGTPRWDDIISPLEAGLTYTTENFQFTASAYYQFLQNISHPIAPGQRGRVSFDSWSFRVGVVKRVDLDRNARTPSGVRHLNDKYRKLEEKNMLSAWFVGIGPTSGLQIAESPFIQNQHPDFTDEYFGSISFDVAVGRYFHKPDMNVALSYRTFGDGMSGFDTQIGLRRHSIMLEAHKYLFNYLGFVPYAGVTTSMEHLQVSVNGQIYQAWKPAIGLIAGWDIRVVNTENSLLRTNLRWTPGLHLNVEGDAMRFDQLEFNFIQWIVFIGRKKALQG